MSNSEKELTPTQQLLLLKDLTVRFGQVNGAQLHQLRMWGLLYDKVESTEVRVDTKNQEATIILYGTEVKKSDESIPLLENIQKWVRFILWDDTKLIITINDEEVIWENGQAR